MTEPNEFAVLHKQLKKAIETQDRLGWQSAEIEVATKQFLQAIWIVANNEPAPVLMKILKQYADKLGQVKRETGDPAGPNDTAD